MTVLTMDYKKIPERSGIYVFFDDSESVLYVGKSKNMRSRIYSHLQSDINLSTHKISGCIGKVSVIFHEDHSSLRQKEIETIGILKPVLNSSNNSKQKEFYLPSITYREVHNKKCRYYGCEFYQLSNGYCVKHDPDNFKYSWIVTGKFISTEMKRLLFENSTIHVPMSFYMSKSSFSKLYKEHDFEMSRDEEGTFKFGKHSIFFDDDDEVRLFRH